MLQTVRQVSNELGLFTQVPICEVCSQAMNFEEIPSPFSSGKSLKKPTWDGHENCKKELDRRAVEAAESARKERDILEALAIVAEAFRLSTLNSEKRKLETFIVDEHNAAAYYSVVNWEYPTKGFLFWGKPGTGKTHLLAGIIRKLCIEKQLHCLIVQVRPWLDQILQAPYEQSQELLRLAETVSVLALDDLGAGALTESADERLQRVLDARTEFDRPTFASTNLLGVDFARILSPRTLSRAIGLMHPLEVAGFDHRRNSHE